MQKFYSLLDIDSVILQTHSQQTWVMWPLSHHTLLVHIIRYWYSLPYYIVTLWNFFLLCFTIKIMITRHMCTKHAKTKWGSQRAHTSLRQCWTFLYVKKCYITQRWKGEKFIMDIASDLSQKYNHYVLRPRCTLQQHFIKSVNNILRYQKDTEWLTLVITYTSPTLLVEW